MDMEHPRPETVGPEVLHLFELSKLERYFEVKSFLDFWLLLEGRMDWSLRQLERNVIECRLSILPSFIELVINHFHFLRRATECHCMARCSFQLARKGSYRFGVGFHLKEDRTDLFHRDSLDHGSPVQKRGSIDWTQQEHICFIIQSVRALRS